MKAASKAVRVRGRRTRFLHELVLEAGGAGGVKPLEPAAERDPRRWLSGLPVLEDPVADLALLAAADRAMQEKG